MSDHQHDPQHDTQHDPPHDSQHGAAPATGDLTHMFTEEFWDERYASSHRIWSGRPNARLVEEIAGLTPGTALDVGCGEGADAVWLAAQGWSVTGVDVSGVAIARAAEHATQAGVADRTSWQRVDVFALDPLPVEQDLVTASFVHVPPDRFEAVYRHLAASVAVGGSLVVLAHHPDDVHTGLRNAELSHLLFTPQAVTALLDPAHWEVATSTVMTREHVHDGTAHQVSDTVVRGVRRS